MGLYQASAVFLNPLNPDRQCSGALLRCRCRRAPHSQYIIVIVPWHCAIDTDHNTLVSEMTYQFMTVSSSSNHLLAQTDRQTDQVFFPLHKNPFYCSSCGIRSVCVAGNSCNVTTTVCTKEVFSVKNKPADTRRASEVNKLRVSCPAEAEAIEVT